MSKKFLSLAMTLIMAFTVSNVWGQYSYSMDYDDHLTGTLNRSDRKTTDVALTGSESGVHTTATGQTGNGTPVFYDLTETVVWEVVPGETLTPTLAYQGEWMHKFVYIDFGQDGKFDVNLTGSGPFTIGENNDIVAWSCIDGYDSDGQSVSNNGSAAIPSFELPADLAAGDYRCRFKVDWNDPTPAGTTKDFVSGAGIMVDVILRVAAPAAGWDAKKVYTLQPVGSSVYATTQLHPDQTQTASYIFKETAENFKITGSDEEGWTFQSAETEKFIGISATKAWNCDDVQSAWDIVAVEGEEDTYYIYQHGQTSKGLGWNAGATIADKGYFTDKSGCAWLIKEGSTDVPPTVEFTVKYTTKGFDAELGDVFTVMAGDEAIENEQKITEAKTIVITATAGEGRMVTLTVNKKKVNSPYTIEDCTEDIEISAKYEAFRSPTATKDVYQTLDLFGDDMMDLFAKADAEGRMFPTDAEFEAIGVNLADLAFVRSHVRPQEILDRANRIIQDTYEKRNLWMNLPIGIGKEKGGYPSSNFSDDAYTGWNYTNLFGSWNHGLLHSPGVAADCAHKNGCDIMSGIKFFESWTAGSGAAGWVKKVQETSEDGYLAPSGKKYKYVRPIVNALLYFGKDGINYNFEDTGYQSCAEFHSCCYDYAAEIGFTNFHVGLYTAMSSLSDSNVGYMLGKYDESRPGKGQCYDTFLNYVASNFASASSIRGSVEAAEGPNGMGTTEDVYQGTWIVSMNRGWDNLVGNAAAKRMGVVLWGEHAQSRLLSYCTGTSSLDFQKNYQILQDRVFSGGNRNPLARPAKQNADWSSMENFRGLAEFIPERSAIHQNLPFTTYFSTGNGDRYNYKGKKTLGTWYNLGQQDFVPTYRWLVYDKGTTTPNITDVPYFTHTDAYIGGSSLYLDNENAVDVVLYRAELTVSAGNPVARIALKRVEGAPEGTVSVIVKKKGSDEWLETAFANVKGNTWEEQEAALVGIAQGDVIEYVGLRTSGNTKGLMVGMLQLDDDVKVAPAEIIAESVLAEVVEECQQSLSVKLRWNVNQTNGDRAKFGMIYNDECNIDHFELLYKDGADGRVSEVGRTTSWSGYVGNIPTDETTRPFVGVRAVSIDGKTYTDVTWIEIPRAHASSLPEALSSSGNYPAIILDNSSDGLESALNNRWIRKFEVKESDGDFTYEDNIGTPYKHDILNGVKDKDADKTNYVFAEDYVIKVHQGQEVKCTFDFQTESDALWYCTLQAYADWDCSEGFDGEGDEVVLLLGESNQKAKVTEMVPPYTFTLKVPEDAVPGASRLRMVWSDAWFPHPGAAGAHNKGFAIDFPMEITGDNPGREAAADTHDEGIADEPVGIGGETTIELNVNDVITADNVAGLKDGSVVAFMYGQIGFAGKAWLNADQAPIVTEEEEVIPENGQAGSYLMEAASDGHFYLRDMTTGKYISRSAGKAADGSDQCDIVMVDTQEDGCEFEIVPTVASNANVYKGETDKTSQLLAKSKESWTEAENYNCIKLGGNTGVAANWGLGGNGPWKLWRVYYLGQGIFDAIHSVQGATSFVVVDGELRFENTDKVWIYTADGRLVKFVDGGVQSLKATGLHGAYIVRMQGGQVQRTRKIVF